MLALPEPDPPCPFLATLIEILADAAPCGDRGSIERLARLEAQARRAGIRDETVATIAVAKFLVGPADLPRPAARPAARLPTARALG